MHNTIGLHQNARTNDHRPRRSRSHIREYPPYKHHSILHALLNFSGTSAAQATEAAGTSSELGIIF